MAKARSVTARFTTEVAPAKVLSITRRRMAAPVRRLDPIAEDDREQLAYWSESSYHHHQQLQADDDGEFVRDLGKCSSDGHGQRGRRTSSSRKQSHRRVVVVV
ncbi:unnamed protein product [Urochloa humidicola]